MTRTWETVQMSPKSFSFWVLTAMMWSPPAGFSPKGQVTYVAPNASSLLLQHQRPWTTVDTALPPGPPPKHLGHTFLVCHICSTGSGEGQACLHFSLTLPDGLLPAAFPAAFPQLLLFPHPSPSLLSCTQYLQTQSSL